MAFSMYVLETETRIMEVTTYYLKDEERRKEYFIVIKDKEGNFITAENFFCRRGKEGKSDEKEVAKWLDGLGLLNGFTEAYKKDREELIRSLKKED